MGGVIGLIVIMVATAVCGTTSDRLDAKGYKQPDSAITAVYQAWIAPDTSSGPNKPAEQGQ